MEKEINENIDYHVSEISKEFKRGFEFLRKYPKTVTFFGTARSTPDSSHYQDAMTLSEKIVRETGYVITTGGGPGIMEAASHGAKNADGKAIGITINIKKEQKINKHISDSVPFNYFFVRKAILTFSTEALVFFPGGFGTFDELFSILTLRQTGKIPSVPIILVGSDFWTPLKDFLISNMLNRHHTISNSDIELFTITDDHDEIVSIIKKAPVSQWWKMMD